MTMSMIFSCHVLRPFERLASSVLKMGGIHKGVSSGTKLYYCSVGTYIPRWAGGRARLGNRLMRKCKRNLADISALHSEGRVF